MEELRKVSYRIIDVMDQDDLEHFIRIYGSALDIDSYTEDKVHELQAARAEALREN